MKDSRKMLWLVTGVVIGIGGTAFYLSPGKQAQAANDRFEDYIICTGAVATQPARTRGPFSPTDGVWLLDYRSGKLLGTVIDRVQGKIVGWAEMDLVAEFGIQARQNVHFLMTTGNITLGQAALYVAETTTGKFGVYTLAPRQDGPGFMISRHDQVAFRGQAKAN